MNKTPEVVRLKEEATTETQRVYFRDFPRRSEISKIQEKLRAAKIYNDWEIRPSFHIARKSDRCTAA